MTRETKKKQAVGTMYVKQWGRTTRADKRYGFGDSYEILKLCTVM